MGLFSWFFRRSRLTAKHRDRFTGQVRRELLRQRALGAIRPEEFDRIAHSLDDPITAQRVIVYARKRVGSIDWGTIAEWVTANWFTIAKIVLSLAFLFLGQEDEDESRELWPEE